MTFFYTTNDEVLIRHYNNYLWFKQNGEALIEEINMIYDNLKYSCDSTYTIRRNNFNNKIGDKIKINDSMSSNICIIIDHLNINDFIMLSDCQYTINPNRHSKSTLWTLYYFSNYISYGAQLKEMFLHDLKNMKYNIKLTCLYKCKLQNLALLNHQSK